MIRAIAMVVAMVATAPEVQNPMLAEGIRLYEQATYSEALVALAKAIERPSAKADSARIHLYIGLIQFRYKLKGDAEASFNKAFEYDRGVRLPSQGVQRGARKLYRRIKKEKVGDEEIEGDDEAKKKKKKKKDDGVRYRDEDEGDEYEEVSEPPVIARVPPSVGERADSRPVDRDPIEPDDDSRNDTRRRPVDDRGDEYERYRPRENADRRVLPPTAEVRPSSGTSIGGWVALGIGAVAVGVGVTLGVVSKYNANAANIENDPSRAAALSQAASAQRTGAFVSLGAAGVSLGLAAVFFLTE